MSDLGKGRYGGRGAELDCQIVGSEETLEVVKLDANGNVVIPKMPETIEADLAPLLSRLNLVSSVVPQTLMAESANEVGQMYRPVGGGELQRNKDGTFTTVLRGKDGKITKHVPLERGNAIEEAAKIGWAITSIVVGQAHLMNIADELTKLNRKIDELKQIAYDEEISKVEASIRSLSWIDFSDKAEAKKMMHDDCRTLDEGCLALYKALYNEVKAMPETGAMTITQGWFGGNMAHRPEEAEDRFRTILKLLPVYLRGMFVLTVMNAYRNVSMGSPDECLTSRLRKLVEDLRLREKVKMVPMISEVDEAPDAVVDKLLEAIQPMSEHLMKIQSKQS